MAAEGDFGGGRLDSLFLFFFLFFFVFSLLFLGESIHLVAQAEGRV